MKVVLFLTLIYCLFFTCLCELRFVFEMFRHGARGPWTGVDKDGTDIFGEFWVSDGELTEVGMRQHYLLGYRNKLRYQNFLSSTYNPKDIYVVSTDVNRTIMSASSQLQGLYSAGNGPILTAGQQVLAIPPNNKTDYESEKKKLSDFALPNQMQTLPIHLFDLNAHTFNLHDAKLCPGVAPYLEKNKEKQQVQEFYKLFQTTYGEKLKKALNITDDQWFYTYDHVYSFCDTFISDYTEGKEMKILTDEGIDLEEMKDMVFQFMYIDILLIGFGDKDSKVAKVSMSPTMLNLVEWIDTRIDRDIKGLGYDGYPSPKIVMYSAHDTNMAALQTYLKSVVKNDLRLYYTPFASNIFFELSRPDGVDPKTLTAKDYVVEVIYNDINLFSIAYPDFKSKIEEFSMTSDEIAVFCGFDPAEDNGGLDIFMIATIVLSIVSAGLVVVIIFLLCKNKKDTPAHTGYTNIV